MPDKAGIPDAMAKIQRFGRVAIVAAVLVAILFAVYGALDRRNILANGEDSANQVAEHTALVAAATLDSTRQILRAMAFLVQPPTLREPPNPAMVRSALLRLKAQNPHLMDLLVIGGDGRIRHWTGNGVPPDVRDRAYFSVHVSSASSGLHVGEPLVSKVHPGKWFFALSEAVRDDQGAVLFVLAAIVDAALFHERLSVQFKVTGSSQALLADDGTVYARNPDNARHVGKKVARPRELAALTSNNRSLTIVARSQLDQVERILAFHRLDDYPLTAVGTVVVADLLAGWTQRMVMLGWLWLLLAGAIAWLARRADGISRAQAELANVDELTGLSNRRSILNTASVLERSQEHAGSLSLLMIDVDHFKSINDRFGHQVGDDMLRMVSGILRSQVRGTDIVGRYGGEEFLVLMPDTGPEGALQVAEKLRKSVADKIVQPDPITISIGVATTSEHDVTLDRTLSRADAALYAAKAAGRNRVCVAAVDQGFSSEAGDGRRFA